MDTKVRQNRKTEVSDWKVFHKEGTPGNSAKKQRSWS